MNAFGVIAGLLHGAAAAACVSVVVARGRRSGPRWRLLYVCALAGVVLSFIAALDFVDSLLLRTRSGSERSVFLLSATVAAVTVAAVGLTRIVPRANNRAVQDQPPSPLLVANLLCSLASAAVVGAVTYVSCHAVLPERGPLWMAPLIVVGAIAATGIGFVIGHVLWLLWVSQHYEIEAVWHAIGADANSGPLTALSRVLLLYLDRRRAHNR